jgi:hypothetical protein
VLLVTTNLPSYPVSQLEVRENVAVAAYAGAADRTVTVPVRAATAATARRLRSFTVVSI